MWVVGLKETIGPSPGIHRQLQWIYPRIWQFFDVIFLPNMQFECCMILQGTPGGNFDIFAAIGEATAWVLLWKTVQDQLAWGFVLYPNSISSVPHLIRASGQWLYAGKKVWDVSQSWFHLRTKEEITPIIRLNQTLLSLMILKFPLVHKVPQPRAPPEPHQPPGQPGVPSGWPAAPSPAGGRERVETRNTSRERWHPHPATFTAWASKYANTNEWWRRWWWSATTGREANTTVQIAWSSISSRTSAARTTNSTNGQMMRYQMRILRLLIPYHHQLDHCHQLNRGISPEEPKDLDHVSEYTHVHPRMLANNNSLLYLFHREYSRIWFLRVKMKIRQPWWVHRIGWVIIEGHCKFKKIHGERVHKHRRERKILQKISRVHRKRPRRISLWIQMKTMKNLSMSLLPLQNLKLLYQYYLFIKDQQPVRKDQLQVLILVMKTAMYSDEYSAQSQDSRRTVHVQIDIF